jgi:hypothetical protein
MRGWRLRRWALLVALGLLGGCPERVTIHGTPSENEDPGPVDEAPPAEEEPPVVPPGADPATVDSNVFFYEGFDADGFVGRFQDALRPENMSRVTNPLFMGATSLRVNYPAGSNYGGSLNYRFADAGLAEPEELYGRYYLRISGNFDPGQGGKLPGPAGTYGRAGWGGRESDGYNGWSARMGFSQSGVASNQIQLHYYAYHVTSGEYGEWLYWNIANRGSLEKDRWYCIETYVKLNTPGQEDGVLRGWVDGELAADYGGIRFRDTSDLKIEEFWINHYYGGLDPVPHSQDVYMDNFALSSKPIGLAK